MTHKKLVEAAYKWLVKNGGVGVAFKELKSCASEIPDVIGFDSWQSILIECKASRADFFADSKKAHRSTFKGMGNWRFYCCPTGMIKVNELPPGWGLIYVNETGMARIKYDCRRKTIPSPETAYLGEDFKTRIVTAEENRFDADTEEERRIMYTALRRLFIRGLVKHIYVDEKSRPDANEVLQLNEL